MPNVWIITDPFSWTYITKGGLEGHIRVTDPNLALQFDDRELAQSYIKTVLCSKSLRPIHHTVKERTIG